MNTRDYLWTIALLVFLMAFSPIATHFIDLKQARIDELRVDLVIQRAQNEQLIEQLNIAKGYIIHDAIVTMYEPKENQTDSTPGELADGTKINIYSKRLHSLRFVALSRDLLKRWGGPYDLGDFIVIEGAERYSGVWQIRDVMAPHWVRQVDILTSIGTNEFKFENVKLTKYDVAMAD